MTKHLSFFTGAALVMAMAAPLAAAPGYRVADLDVAHRAETLQVHVWYPTDAKGGVTQLGRNLLFQGVEVQVNAPPKPEAFPIVLLSHGSGGNAVNLAWIAADLANRGIVVVATNHPGTTSGDSAQDRTIKVWERPQDLSAMLDALPQILPDGATADLDRIAVLGFSLGGHSALSLAGAQVSKADFVSYCADNPSLLDCGWYAAGGVDLNAIDQQRYEQSNLDRRIRAVVSVDPGLAQAFVTQSLRSVEVPVLVVNLMDDGKVPMAIDGRKVAEVLPNGQFVAVENAVHFSFLGACRGLGRAIVWLIGEDPICTDAGGRDRDSIHRELSGKIGGFLGSVLLQS